MRFRFSEYVLSAIALLFALPLTAAAQFDMSSEAFTLTIYPQYPAPHSTVSITPLSSLITLANATMVVSVNGKELSRGPAQPFVVTLGRAGEVSNVRVFITSNGESYSETVSLAPQDVLLIPEPLASAPALYPGKPLIPLEGRVRMVAFANMRDASGAAVNPSTLSYAWSVDGAQKAAASGIGRSTLILTAPLQYRDRTVEVVVQSQDGTLVGGASYSLATQAPTVRIYENDPLLGIRFERVLPDAYAIRGAESSLYGAAYSFPTSFGAPSLQWFLNGDAVQSGSVVTLRPAGSGAGTATLSLVGIVSELTRATAQLSVSFGASGGSNFFGL